MPIHEVTYTKGDVLLSLDKVGLRYGERWILRDVSAQVQDIHRPGFEQGQVVCFLGPSGIGKTRLARLISGLEKPTEGSIEIMGTGKMTATRAGLCGFVQQSYPLFHFMTIGENLRVAATMEGKRKLDKGSHDIHHYLQQLGLDARLLPLYPKQLSGGQRQRIAIIRQLLCSEHFLILDEPFSGLDIKAKAKACILIQQVAQLHTLNTIIVITHDVTEGMSVADTVWLMGVDEAGQPAHLIETYDLAAEGLAWRAGINEDVAFRDRVVDVKKRFLEVAP